MMKKIVMIACGLSLLNVTGCAWLGETMRSKETQGMVLGGLLGAGAMTLGVWAFNRDEGTGRLGAWAAGGGVIGGLAGWYIGHQMEPHDENAQR